MALKTANLLNMLSKTIHFSVRKLSVCPLLNAKAPRVLPVCHQVLGEHNKQYFTPYPYHTKEELEEPPPKVSDEVRDLLQRSRPKYIGLKWIRPEIPPWKFRMIRRKLAAEGHYFPVLPMRDRMLDMMPKVKQKVLKKEEKLKRIEENMKMMPQWIAEYREKRRLQNIKKKEQKMENKIALLQIEKLGLHPKDPRAQQIMQDGLSEIAKKPTKKKFGDKKKE